MNESTETHAGYPTASLTEAESAATASGPAPKTLAEIQAEADATAAELAKHEAADKDRKVAMGDTVIVRHKGKSVPGIILDVREDGSIDVQTFHGDHVAHSAHKLTQVDADSTGDGWYPKA